MNFNVKIYTAELVKLVGELGNAAQILSEGAADGANKAARVAREATTQRITSQVYLEPSYVDDKVVFAREATPGKPQAVLEVSDSPVSMARYGAQQRIQSNVWTAAKYAATFGTVAAPIRLPSGKVAQWIPRTGDQLRGISAGSKQAGITAAVSRNKGTSTFSHVFLMPVLSGKAHEGRWGAFSRPKGGGKARALYGPSAYQVTKGVWAHDFLTEVGDFMEAEVTGEVTRRIANELGAT